jgi:hypothetical protein
MKKKAPTAPLVTVRPPKKAGLLRKTARMGAAIVATRVAASTGKKGALGLLAGMGAKRIIMHYPMGALFVSGAYLAGRLLEARRDLDSKKAARLAPDPGTTTVLLEDARTRKAQGKG